MADSFVPQSVLAQNVSTTAFTLGAGNWARRWGRPQPVHGTTGSPEAIIGEVRSGVYTTDLAGLAYGSDVTWARCQFQDDGAAVGEGELRSLWAAVPTALPAGYTSRGTRNIGLAVTMSTGSAAGDGSGVYFTPSASLAGFVRTATGLYTPKDNSAAFTWGPWNRDNLALQESFDASSVTGDATNNPQLFSPVAPADGSQTFSDLAGGTRKHPGFRSIRYVASWAPEIYNHAGGYPNVTSMSTQLRFLSGGLGTLTVVTARSDLSLNATTNRYEKDWGNVGALLMPVGSVGKLDHFTTVTYTGSWVAGVSYFLYQCPRVDIPLPYWSSYGNAIAPGGILTGSIPGY